MSAAPASSANPIFAGPEQIIGRVGRSADPVLKLTGFCRRHVAGVFFLSFGLLSINKARSFPFWLASHKARAHTFRLPRNKVSAALRTRVRRIPGRGRMRRDDYAAGLEYHGFASFHEQFPLQLHVVAQECHNGFDPDQFRTGRCGWILYNVTVLDNDVVMA